MYRYPLKANEVQWTLEIHGGSVLRTLVKFEKLNCGISGGGGQCLGPLSYLGRVQGDPADRRQAGTRLFPCGNLALPLLLALEEGAAQQAAGRGMLQGPGCGGATYMGSPGWADLLPSLQAGESLLAP